MDKLNHAPPSAPLPEPEPPSQNAAPARLPKSAGDRAFDLGVYGGLGYLANAAISLAVTRYAVQKKGTTLHRLAQHSEKGFTKLFDGIFKDAEKASHWGAFSNNIFCLGSGGWLLLLPIKWLEDNKAGIVQSIDGTLGTGPKDDFERALQAAQYDNGPKQSYTSLFSGRVVSYAVTVMAALPFITEKTRINANLNRFLNKHLGKHLGELSEPLLVVNERTTNMPEFIDTLSKESILAGTAAGLHYGASKFFAKAGHEILQRPNAANLPEPPNQERVSASANQNSAPRAEISASEAANAGTIQPKNMLQPQLT